MADEDYTRITLWLRAVVLFCLICDQTWIHRGTRTAKAEEKENVPKCCLLAYYGRCGTFATSKVNRACHCCLPCCPILERLGHARSLILLCISPSCVARPSQGNGDRLISSHCLPEAFLLNAPTRLHTCDLSPLTCSFVYNARSRSFSTLAIPPPLTVVHANSHGQCDVGSFPHPQRRQRCWLSTTCRRH